MWIAGKLVRRSGHWASGLVTAWWSDIRIFKGVGPVTGSSKPLWQRSSETAALPGMSEWKVALSQNARPPGGLTPDGSRCGMAVRGLPNPRENDHTAIVDHFQVADSLPSIRSIFPLARWRVGRWLCAKTGRPQGCCALAIKGGESETSWRDCLPRSWQVCRRVQSGSNRTALIRRRFVSSIAHSQLFGA